MEEQLPFGLEALDELANSGAVTELTLEARPERPLRRVPELLLWDERMGQLIDAPSQLRASACAFRHVRTPPDAHADSSVAPMRLRQLNASEAVPGRRGIAEVREDPCSLGTSHSNGPIARTRQ